MYKIILDLHGCLADFEKQFRQHHNAHSSWSRPGSYDLECAGVPRKNWWKCIDREFWQQMEPTCEAGFILNMLRKNGFEYNDIAVVTHFPYDSGMNLEQIGEYQIGNLLWLKKYYPMLVDNFFVGANKCFFARPNFILIDDHDKNVDQFEMNGAIGILVPRIWNRLHAFRSTGAVIHHIHDEFEKKVLKIDPLIKAYERKHETKN